MVERQETFDPLYYWEQHLQAYPGIKGVGYTSRSTRFLEQQYRSRMRQVELALRQYGLTDLTGRKVLDVGSGTGIWLDFWHRHGVEAAVGLDFAQPSIEALRTQFPDDLIVQADVSKAPLPLPDNMRFDLISAFDVLLHIVDPDNFRRAIANLAHHCLPGGWLVISDAIVQGQGYVPERAYAVFNKVRRVDEYREVLAANGFVIDSIRPATVLLGNPLEAPNRLAFLALSAWWKGTGLWGRSNTCSGLIGPGVVKADQVACRLFNGSLAPTAKIMFARKLL
ncbi:MAG TPA: class I SAM-dependent methyltransferase [Ktedonobacteraceae bacterium]|nr:class I SAM-dependent methyltransferase [Ktedonobacteraceae bacterium]